MLIAAVSARPFATAAAAAGYEVVAIDVFGDADTRRAAQQIYSVKYIDGHFDAVDFKRALDSIDLNQCLGLVYGSGLEAVPDLLESVAGYLPVLGNSPQVLRNLKRPRQFFALLDALNIPHPEVSLRALDAASGWLYKQGGGSGGIHIRRAQANVAPGGDGYFQRGMEGNPVSLLFAADGREAKVIGFNQQWVTATDSMPYRYGGAVSHAPLPATIREKLSYAAQSLTCAIGLRGLNSLDAVMEDNQLWVLEVNPRLSATFDLYQSELRQNAAYNNLITTHLRACAGDLTDWPQISEHSRAHQIIYASADLEIKDEMIWPEWVADVPISGTCIMADNPVCTVKAEGENAEAARALVLSRTKMLEEMLKFTGNRQL